MMTKDKKTSMGITLLMGMILCAVQLSFAQNKSSTPTYEQRVALFDYDKDANLGLIEVGIEKRGSVTIRDVTFAGIPGENPVQAYIVVPEGPGPFAGVLWGHWLGHHTSNRTQYLEEAVALATKGVVSILINAMWAEPSWYESRIPEEDYNKSIRQVIEMRRAMDLLATYDKVDQKRIAYVGHDYSGMYGAIAAAMDQRAKTYVFIAVTSSLYDWAFFAKQPKSKIEYVRQNAVFELTDFVSKIEGSFFCQFSINDPFISKTDGNLFFNAINSEVKEKKRYEAGHFMKGDDINTDRTAWLVKELGLTN